MNYFGNNGADQMSLFSMILWVAPNKPGASYEFFYINFNRNFHLEIYGGVFRGGVHPEGVSRGGIFRTPFGFSPFL